MSFTNPRAIHAGDGATTAFAVPFPYQLQSDVLVYVDGALKVVVTDYTFTATGTITFVAAPAAAAVITFKRVTYKDAAKHQAQAGSLRPTDLNENSLQEIYVGQEAVRDYQRTLHQPETDDADIGAIPGLTARKNAGNGVVLVTDGVTGDVKASTASAADFKTSIPAVITLLAANTAATMVALFAWVSTVSAGFTAAITNAILTWAATIKGAYTAAEVIAALGYATDAAALAGSLPTAVTTTAVDATVPAGTLRYLVDATAANRTITVPRARTGQGVWIGKKDSTYNQVAVYDDAPVPNLLATISTPANATYGLTGKWFFADGTNAYAQEA